MLRIQSKPVRTVLVWQVVATVLMAVIAGLLAGIHVRAQNVTLKLKNEPLLKAFQEAAENFAGGR